MRIANVKIERVIRKMRGGSQSHLVQAQDGRYYVAKFINNPQGHRILINEWITHGLMRKFGISVPDLRVLELPDELRRQIYFSVANNHIYPVGYLHLGIQCPTNPEEKAIFDFLPRKLMSSVINLDEFAAVYVLDHWLCQTDGRQAIFIREPSKSARAVFRAYFIDNGFALGGNSWDLSERPLMGLYKADRNVYSMIDMTALCEKALTAIQSISDSDFQSFTADIPSEWFDDGDRESLNAVLLLLCHRISNLRTAIQECPNFWEQQLSVLTPMGDQRSAAYLAIA